MTDELRPYRKRMADAKCNESKHAWVVCNTEIDTVMDVIEITRRCLVCETRTVDDVPRRAFMECPTEHLHTWQP